MKSHIVFSLKLLDEHHLCPLFAFVGLGLSAM